MLEIENTKEKKFQISNKEKLWKNVKKRSNPSHHTETPDIITS